MWLKGMRDWGITLRLLCVLFAVGVLFACSSDKSAIRKDVVYDPEARFQDANEKIKKRDYEEARSILEEIRRQDTSDKYAALARIRIGDTYFEDGMYEEAIAEYRSFLGFHTYHNYASHVQYRLAMGYFKRIKKVDTGYSMAKQALEEFEKLRTLYPRNPYMDLTDRRIKKCKEILAEYELYVGEFYMKKGSHQAAIDRFTVVLEEYPGSKMESEALYYLALSYRDMGEREKARKALTTLIDRFPDVHFSEKAKELLAPLGEEE
jgi:outer membrane protein assembly factor BamD